MDHIQESQVSPPPMPQMQQAAPPAERPEYTQLLQLDTQFRPGIKWFYWIGGLSLVNSVLLLSGANMSFIVGLGATQVVDAIAAGIAEEVQAGWTLKLVALAIDVVIAGMYVLIGFLGLKRIKTAIIVGMILYALDGLIFLLAKDFLSILFHAFALYCIFSGLKMLMAYNKLEAQLVASEPGAV